MKTMMCKDLGGPCDHKLSAETWKEMEEKAKEHVKEFHPELAKEMEEMNKVDPHKWGKEMKAKWEATPDD